MPIIGSKFVIVGGAGLVGSAVARALAAGVAPVIVCDGVEASQWAGLPPDLDDLWGPEELQSRLDQSWRDVAGIAVFADGPNAFAPMRRLWDVASARQRPLYWASTLQVYGTSHPGVSGEPAAFAPVSAFGRAHRAMEVFAARRSLEHDAPPVATAFRLASVYGAGEGHKASGASLPYRAVQSLSAGQPVEVWRSTSPDQTDGSHQRDWIHVDDAAAIIAAVITGGLQGPFDVGTGVLTSATSIVNAASRATGMAPAVIHVDPPAFAAVDAGVAADLSPLAAAGVDPSAKGIDAGMAELAGRTR